MILARKQVLHCVRCVERHLLEDRLVPSASSSLGLGCESADWQDVSDTKFQKRTNSNSD
jgi:hypothetical protein